MDIFEGMGYAGDLPATVAFDEVGDILKKVGLISVGSIGGAMLRDKVLSTVIKEPMLSTAAEAGIGVLGAAFALNQRSDALFWLLVGVGVHGVTDLLRQAFGTVGILPTA